MVSIQVLWLHQCHTKTSLINLMEAQNISNESELGAVQPVNLTIFDDWQKTVLTTTTASGTCNLIPVYDICAHS